MNLIIENKKNEPSFVEFGTQWLKHFPDARIINAVRTDNNTYTLNDHISSDEQYFVYGSISLVDVLSEVPNINSGGYSTHYGYSKFKENFTDILNPDAVICSLPDIYTYFSGDFWMRPERSKKEFIAGVFDLEEANRLFDDKELFFGDEQTKIVVASCKDIQAEYRYFIVNGKISTKSQYRRLGKLFYSSEFVDVELDDFVNNQISNTSFPIKTYVIDVCETNNGIKVVEINRLNSSGLYGCNIEKLIKDLGLPLV